VAEGGGEEQATGARTGTSEVFISYASQELAVADAVVSALERQGLTCWIAPRDVTPGSHYAEGIMLAIGGAKAVILILSGSALASKHVGKEVERASSKGRPIIVLRTDTAPLTLTFEYFLSESQWIDVGTGGIAAATIKLVEAVRTHLHSPVTREPNVSVVNRATAPPRPRWIVAAGAFVVALVLAYFAVDKVWLSKRESAEKPVTAMASAATVSAPPTPAIPAKSVAVLPFVDMSEKKDQEYFSDGLSEELIDMLTRIPELHVPARTSSFYFKGKQTTITEIAKKLGVTHVLEGSVRKNGRIIRITVQLIRADTSYHVWSKTYDRTLDDIFKIQDEIAGAVVSALRTSLSTNAVHDTPKSLNADSYALLMQAQYFLLRQTRDDQHKAFEYYQRAVDSDPMSAAAWAGLSRVTANLHSLGELPWKKAFGDALQFAERAVALDPQLTEAHIALGKVYLNLGHDYAAAKREIDKARALDPENNVVLFWMSSAALAAGDLANAEEFAQQASAKDPLDGETYMMLGQAYYCEGRFSEAEDSYRKALDLIPARPALHSTLGLVLLARGKHEEALQEITRETDLGEQDTALAGTYQILGRTADARSALAQLEAERGNSDAYSIAQIYALRGDRERTFLWLDRAYQQHEYFMQMKVDPWFSSVRGDPRYKALLRKNNLPE
jgi:TolB-like protein/tetratricopeptide (TPR) repeat protein